MDANLHPTGRIFGPTVIFLVGHNDRYIPEAALVS
jgi:hypothetical protein